MLMYCPIFGQQSPTPFVAFGKKQSNMTQAKFKKVRPWRCRLGEKSLVNEYIDTSTISTGGFTNEKNFRDDVLVPLLRIICQD
mmetsp:Transcript_36655/g.56221  ORF Transcript_36655/g.56221 Transcript_36655/m.56221 type:complete len:83 (-) Transcript_36655:87-335(-)